MIFSIFICTLFSLSRTPGQAFLQPEMLLSIIRVNYILQLIFFFCDFKSIPLSVRVSSRFIAARSLFLGRSKYILSVFISPSLSLSFFLSFSLSFSLSISLSLSRSFFHSLSNYLTYYLSLRVFYSLYLFFTISIHRCVRCGLCS